MNLDLETEKIEILLATFQSEKFLSEQIDSILSQTDPNWTLLIRDGGSSDSTPEIIDRYVRRDPDRIRFLGSSRTSACKNFSLLLEAARAELVMPCDHDDVWLPEKIALTRKRYIEEYRKNPPGTPILIFSDLRIVDEDLNLISPSLMRYSKLRPDRLSLSRLLVQNVPQGNTMLLNSALRKLVHPIPAEAVMHDSWIALTAAAFGRIGYLEESTILYRQHNGNVFGAFRYSVAFFMKKISEGRKKLLLRWDMNVRQAQAFLECNRSRLAPEEIRMLTRFSSIGRAGFFKKRYILIRYKILKTGFIRNLGIFLII
ncbi:MAG: glycosyltransferase family 2 protein [Lentisphaeria bacterium]|nr:glycosyltransferase family 2 protein [Lentisphaeria bacterium]